MLNRKLKLALACLILLTLVAIVFAVALFTQTITQQIVPVGTVTGAVAIVLPEYQLPATSMTYDKNTVANLGSALTVTTNKDTVTVNVDITTSGYTSYSIVVKHDADTIATLIGTSGSWVISTKGTYTYDFEVTVSADTAGSASIELNYSLSS